MLTYTARRMALTLPLLVGVIFLTFLLMNVIPGNPFSGMLVQKQDPAVVARLMESFGLNDPVHVRFWRYLTGILHGDLGVSLSQNRPVADILAKIFSIILILFYDPKIKHHIGIETIFIRIYCFTDYFSNKNNETLLQSKIKIQPHGSSYVFALIK